ncbi:MAG: hypothetical protein PHS34_09700, partial [Candidatus Omnitrophica bacterium]|nr:hypothetical protein [Candidatus Omnitrophota bacterium]
LDCDDISHPERFFWSIKILDSNPDLKGVSFTPLYFCDDENFLETDRIEKGSPYNLNNPYYTLLDATLLRHHDNRPFLRINPQTLCFKKDIADNIRIPQEICDVDSQIPQMDRIFLYHCLLKYPLGFIQDARLMLFSRRHDNQTCKLKYNTTTNRHLELYYKKELSERIIESLDGKVLNELVKLKNKELKLAGIEQ